MRYVEGSGYRAGGLNVGGWQCWIFLWVKIVMGETRAVVGFDKFSHHQNYFTALPTFAITSDNPTTLQNLQ